jgi:hypothetical protein
MAETSEGAMVQATNPAGVSYAGKGVVFPIHVACFDGWLESREHFHIITETAHIFHVCATVTAPIPSSTAAC